MNKFMQEADKLARENLESNDGGPFGAVVVKEGRIIAVGNNNVLRNNDSTAHAEIEAIREAEKVLKTYDLSGCELYTNCYPCPMCLSAIIWANIKTVYYGNTKEDAREIGFRDDSIYVYFEKLLTGKKCSDNELKLVPMDSKETIKTFELFKNKEDKTIY